MSLGLLNFQNNDDYITQREEERRAEAEASRQDAIESALSAHIKRSWDSAKAAKRDVENRMLDCMRRVKGEYDGDKMAAIRQAGGSEVYMMMTSTKVRALEAWVKDVLIPDGDKPWGLEATPVAEIPPHMMQQLQQQVAQEAAMAAEQEGIEVTEGMLQQAVQQKVKALKVQAQTLAEDAATLMENQIEDQLAEGRWVESLQEFISDFAIFPAAIMKGPILRRKKTLTWGNGWVPEESYEVIPEYERVSPFDFYPSPDASDIDDSQFLIERLRLRRSVLQSMIGVDGYSEESLREVLQEYGVGGLRDWIWTDSERNRLEGKDTGTLTSGDTIDGLHYWGGAQGTQLLQWGVNPDDVPDPLAEYQIDAILIGKHCVRCVINDDPLERRPYGKASFSPIPGSFWGTCIPELMADIQDICNATARSLLNNLAISSGPQVQVQMDRLQPGESASDIFPWKIWKTKSSMAQTGSAQQAISFFQPNSNAAELLNVFNEFEKKADDATNVPRYIYGNERIGGAGNTASGLSMLMESANKGIKAAISQIDTGVIKRMVSAMWLHNMLYSDNPDIKGDLKVVPRGSNAMLQRHNYSQMQMQLFTNLANPEIVQQLLGVRGQGELLRKVLNSAGLNNLISEGAEEAIEQAQSQPNPEQEMAREMMLAEAQAKIQKIQAEAAKLQAGTEKMTGINQVEAEKLQAEIMKIYAEVQKIAGDTVRGQQLNGTASNFPRQTSAQQPSRMGGIHGLAR